MICFFPIVIVCVGCCVCEGVGSGRGTVGGVGSHGNQRFWIPLELKLQAVMSHLMWIPYLDSNLQDHCKSLSPNKHI